MALLSLVVPCYNEKDALHPFMEELVVVCIMMMLSGVQLFCMGIFGQYLAKMYMEIKKRPHYIIAENSDKA